MNDIWDFGIKITTGLGGIAAFAYYACHLAENGLSPTSREKFIGSLEGLRFAPSVRAAFQSFAFAADGIFGPKLVSARALMVSAIWTTSWVVVVLLFGTLFATDRPPIFFFLVIALRYGFVLLCGVVIIDFLCLIKTRLLIRWSLPRGLRLVTLCSAVDLIMSMMIFIYVMAIVFSISMFFYGKAGYSFWTDFIPDIMYAWSRPIDGIVGAAKWPAIESKMTSPGTYNFGVPASAALFWSSMMTSVWMILYLSGYLTMALAVRFDIIKTAVLPVLNFTHKPFSAIGLVILLISLVFSIVAIAVFAVTSMA